MSVISDSNAPRIARKGMRQTQSIFACPGARGNLGKQAVTIARKRIFCLRGTCYIDLSPCKQDWGLPTAVELRATRYPRKCDFIDPEGVGVEDDEECDGIHANRAETGIF